MKLHHRRQFLHLAASAVALSTVTRIASAQTYPSRPLHIIVGFPPGGTVDIIARLLGQWLGERLGQQSVIDDRPGAAGNIATEAVVRSPPDGYTLLMAGSSNATNRTLYQNLNFDFFRDIALVGGIARVPIVMVVNPSFSATTLAEFIAYAKASPGKVTVASAGNGTPNHLSGELFKMMTGVSMIHVPYRGDPPAITDLLGGQVQVAFSTMPPAIEYIRDGRLRALAVTTAARSEILPDIPTLGEFVPGFDAGVLIGVGVPKKTPAEIVEKLNKEINAMLGDPKTKAQITKLGAAVIGGSPADYSTLLADETEKWGKLIRAANIKVQ
jgi:tripartite-type tricarboxylate transporter receptor subunit TctC